MNTVFKWAARYLDNGWSVIPIQEKSKEPLIPWVEYQKRRATKQELAAWVAKWPSMNIGIVTGSISSLVVVDLDGTAGISFGLKARIVSPVSQKTGKGKQVFYKWTEPVANSASKIAPGVDIRGDGGFVVVPPSVHPNGRRYRWERFVPTRLPSLPPRILQASSTGVTPKSKESGWISKALEDMKIGNIDTTLTSILGRLRRDGYSEADAQSLLSPHAERAGATPGHLDEKIRNLWNRYACPAARNDTPSSLHIHAPANDGSYDIFQHYLATTVANGTGLRTGFPTLDKMLAGGLKSERLFAPATQLGWTERGKHSFLLD